jgi:hypothetical protein
MRKVAPIDATKIVIVGIARKAQKTNAAFPAGEDTSKSPYPIVRSEMKQK